LLGRVAAYGEFVAAGQKDDPGFLYVYHGAEGKIDGLDIDNNDDHLREAIKIANPSATGEGAFVDLDAQVRAFRDQSPGVARRFILNVWGHGSDEQWLPPGRWEQLADPDRVVEPGTRVFLGFDGSMVADSTALVGVTAEGRGEPTSPPIVILEDDIHEQWAAWEKKANTTKAARTPHAFVVGVWEPVNGYIDRDAVNRTLRVQGIRRAGDVVRSVRLVPRNCGVGSRVAIPGQARRESCREVPNEQALQVVGVVQPHVHHG
jgi:hypothetical protein